MQRSSSSDKNPLDYALKTSGITLLVADHERFGFSERTCYHFDLIETLTQKPNEDDGALGSRNQDTILSEQRSSSPLPSGDHKVDGIDSKPGKVPGSREDRDQDPFAWPDNECCGVVSLLECIPQTAIKTQRKRKRFLKRINEFNRIAEEEREKHLKEGHFYCHQPLKLPLQLNFNTRVTFAYEMTRMVFCVDASPTLTSTFGNTGHSDGAVCAVDRLEKMVRTYFNGLVVPITGAELKKREKDNTGSAGKNENDTGCTGSKSWWVPEIVVTVIACYPPSMTRGGEEKLSVLVSDFSVHDASSATQLADRIVDWATIEVESEIASRLGRIGGRLDCSSSSLQDIIVQCVGVLSTLPSRGRPMIVLATDCRAVNCDSILDLVRDRKLKDTPLNVLDLSGSHSHRTGKKVNKVHEGPNYLTFEVDSPSEFPLIVPDDSEALHNVCKSTRGYFIDAERLQEAVSTIAGSVPISSSFHHDSYFSFKRRAVRPNALQWYTIFSLSPCCPLSNSSSSNLVSPPSYIQERQIVSKQMLIFSYSLNPIRAKGIIIMRVMDGYRLRKYGSDSQYNDKVSIQFELKLEFGTILHYQFEYVASPSHNAMVGSAKVSVSLSGEPGFVEMVKKKSEYINNQFGAKRSRAMSLKEKTCNRICQFLKWIREEDLIESRICALDWGGKLIDKSEFLQCLAALDKNQLYRHFRHDIFEVIRTGDAMKYLLRDSKTDDDSKTERQIVETVSAWSTRTILYGRLYLRRLPTSEGNLTHYCVVEIKSSNLLRVFSIHMHYFEQVDTNVRVACSKSLQSAIESYTELLIAPRPLSKRVTSHTPSKRASNLHQNEYWELLREPELLPLVAKRRSYFDNFVLVKFVPLEEVVLVKFVPDHSNRLYLVIYHLVMLPDKAVARIYMDREQGIIKHPLFGPSNKIVPPLFTDICVNVKERDHKCARALRSRRNLLNIFDGASRPTELIAINHTEDVKRLLLYATKAVKRLRFFNVLFGKASSILEKLTIDFMLSGGLNSQVAEIYVGESQNIDEMEQGRWFLVRFDSETILSVVHFPSKSIENQDDGVSFRELSFFTVAFADLYYYKADDVNQRTSQEEDDHTLFYVSKFFTDLEAANKHHYATAAYIALRNPLREIKDTLTNSDFEAMMECCTDVTIVEDIEIKEPLGSKGEMMGSKTKLTTLLSSMLSPIPGGSPYFYFRGNENAALDEFSDNSSHSDEVDTVSSSGSGDSSGHADDDISETTNLNSIGNLPSYQIAAPIFVLLTIDGKPATLSEISSIDRSVSLSVFLTIFKRAGTEKKSKLQKAISSLLISHLHSYIAEQTLEQFLWEGKQVSEVDEDTVKMCLLEAENVISWSIPLNFYMPNTDSMIDASTSIGLKEGLHSCFYLLCSCLTKQMALAVTEASGGQFFATDTNLHGWCWINVPEAIGPVSVYAFHHNGIGAAESVAKEALDIVKNACHKLNQILLLETMQRSRTASELLIPADNASSKVSRDTSEHIYYRESNTPTLDLPPGFFQCDIAHRAFYKLHPRCLPSEAILDLQYTVLNSFAVSNRRGIFVYKDEKENIFYMRFEPSEADSQCGIELFVYGIHEAGASITQQLDCLIKKKVMTMGVETISTVLAKSQHFNLPQSDVEFVKSFEDTWRTLDTEHFSPTEEEFYEFPECVYDPVLVLLYFRQNILGSTFFNVWRRPREKSQMKQSVSDTETEDNSRRTGVPFTFDHRDFSLCYNATQFQLNPEFQAISTLTDKGKEYSRKAGTGMALVEIKLLDPNQPLENVQIADTLVGNIPGREFDALQFLQSLRFKKLKRNEVKKQSSSLGRFRLSVHVFNTTLQADAIYRWIELTLNQVLVAWVVERHLERTRLGLLHLPIGTLEDNKERNTNRTLPISKICPGLPSLGGILTSISHLPHPAVKKLEFPCTVKATEVASLSLNCLERGILGPLFGNKKVGAKDVAGLQTLRLCQSLASLVELKHADPSKVVQVYDKDTSDLILDRPMDSPQIIVVYGLNEITEKVRRKDLMESTQSQYAPPIGSFLFQKVSFDDYLADKIPGSLSYALGVLKSKDPYAFMRRVAFILTINRSGVSALFYNLNPQTVESINTKLKEIHNDFSKQTTERSKLQQSRHYQQPIDSVKMDVAVTPTPTIRGSRRVSNNVERQQVASIPEGNEPVSTNKQKKIRSILIPTIVGKSVKGSAYQAQLHSRARARSSTSKTVQGRSNSQRISNQKGKDNSGSKTSSKSSASQQEKDKVSEEEQNYLPPPLKKLFMALQSILAAKSLRRSHTIGLHQSMLLSWFLDSEGKELPFLSMDTILRYATALQTITFPLVPSAVTNPIPFILYFAKTAFPDHTKNINISKNFVWNNKKATGNLEKSTIYLMQRIMSTKSSNVYLMHEISVVHLKGIGKVGKCRSWTFIGNKNAKDFKNWIKDSNQRNFNKKNSIYHREKDSNKVTQVSTLSLMALHPSLKMFMFALNILRRFARGDIDVSISPTQLLHETMSNFPTNIQLRNRIGHWYRLLKRTVLWGKDIAEKLLSFEKILKHVCSEPNTYEMAVCAKDELCFSGSVPCEIKDAHFYVSRSRQHCPDDCISFDLYVLCCTRGSTLERYIFEDGCPLARKLSDHILDVAERKVCDLAQNVSKDIDLGRLWKKYTCVNETDRMADTKKYRSTNCSLEEIRELISLSYSRDYSEVDARMWEILTNEVKELEYLRIPDLIQFMTEDDIIQHYFVLKEGSGVDNSTYLLYLNKSDVILLVELDKNDEMTFCLLIGRNGTNIRDDSLHSSFKEVVAIVDLLAFRWIWGSA